MSNVARALAALTAAAALAVAVTPAGTGASSGGDQAVWCTSIGPGTNGPCPAGPPPITI